MAPKKPTLTIPLAIRLLSMQIAVLAVWQPSAASPQASPEPNSPQAEVRSKARDQLSKGVQAFKDAQYPAAVEHFTAAVELDANFTTARLYLATVFMQQYIPGNDSPDNIKMASKAEDQFQIVLEQDPMNELAINSVAWLYFNEKKLDAAEQWYQKLVAVKPGNKEAYYSLGVIAWTRALQPLIDARAGLGMKPADQGPLKDNNLRAELSAANRPLVEEGFENLDAAIRLDPEYDDAMAYENLLYREKADLEDSAEGYRADMEAADYFVAKTLETRKVKAERNARNTAQDPR
ncbi:MAG: tetratricopeptide repeat protein [Bryobacteraceae bacterium]|jgi:Tfp pilus assembly protein PilF